VSELPLYVHACFEGSGVSIEGLPIPLAAKRALDACLPEVRGKVSASSSSSLLSLQVLEGP